MFKKISNKVVASYAVLISSLIVFFLFFFNGIIKDNHLRIIKREMNEKINYMELSLKKSGAENNIINIKKIVEEISGILALRITIINNEGIVIADSKIDDETKMDNHRYRIEINKAFLEGRGESIRYSNTLKVDMLYTARRWGNYVIRLSKPLFEIEESLSRLRNLIIMLGLAAFAASMIISVYISRRLTGPLKAARRFAEEFSKGNFSRRIQNYSNDEMGSLQQSLNKLADTIVDKIENLIFEQNKLSITIESIQDGIALIDRNRKILIANRAFTELLGISNAPVKGGRIYYESIRGSSINEKIEEILKSGSPSFFEEKLLTGKICEIYINPIKEEDTLQGILLVLHDVTDKKKIIRLKTDLVGNMSHELKTPITILKGYLETIDENIDNRELSKDFIKKALVNLERQDSIINDMLKLNLLESAPDLSIENINLEEIIEGCIEILAPKASAKEVKIEAVFDNIDLTIKGNRFLAEEVFFNLIENAINYNKPGGTVKITADNSGENTTIIIKDNGIGIPEESMDRIFERFYRVNKSRSRQTGGTGLGLSIVKHSAELLNWGICAESEIDKGTVFSVTI